MLNSSIFVDDGVGMIDGSFRPTLPPMKIGELREQMLRMGVSACIIHCRNATPEGIYGFLDLTLVQDPFTVRVLFTSGERKPLPIESMVTMIRTSNEVLFELFNTLK